MKTTGRLMIAMGTVPDETLHVTCEVVDGYEGRIDLELDAPGVAVLLSMSALDAMRLGEELLRAARAKVGADQSA